MSGPEERQRAVDLCLTTPMTTAQVVEHLGHPTRQCLERRPAKDPRHAGHMAKPIIPLETRTKAIEPVPGGMQRKRAAERLGAGLGAVHNWVKAHREGGMAALQPKNRNAGQADKPAMRRDRDAGDAEAPRRRVEEPELENAVMREVVEARRKRPGRRPMAPVGQGEDASGRPSAPDVFTQLDSASRRAATYYHHARLGVDKYARLRVRAAGAFAASKGGHGYRRVKAMLRTGVSEKAPRRIMAENGPTTHVPERHGYSSYEGGTAPAPGNLADRDFTAEMPNWKRPADITRDQGRGREGRASRRRSTATTARSSRTRPGPVPTPGSPTGCSSRPRRHCRRERIPWCIPTADATAGDPDGWRSWTATAWHGRRAPRAVPRTTPPRRGSSDA